MSPLTNFVFGVAMGGLLLKIQNFKKVKLIFGHPVLHVVSLMFITFSCKCHKIISAFWRRWHFVSKFILFSFFLGDLFLS